MYQLLSAWDNFITCGTEDKCHEEQCSKICDVVNKDPPDMDMSDLSTANSDIKGSESVTTYATYDTTADKESHSLTSTTVPDEQGGPLEHSTTDQQSATERSLTNHPSKESRTSANDETTETKAWPKKKHSDARKNLEEGDLDETNRKTKVEAQQQDVKVKSRSAGQTNVLNQSIFFGYFILACLI